MQNDETRALARLKYLAAEESLEKKQHAGRMAYYARERGKAEAVLAAATAAAEPKKAF